MSGHILFLCTGNSARSQMAEGLVNSLWGRKWQAYSAGTAPVGYVHPLAIRVMAEWGIDLSQGRSKGVDVLRGMDFDLVVTVCDDAARDCPLWLGGGKKVHLGFPDPAKVGGTEEERLAAFRQVRDGLYKRLSRLLGEAK
ncbi:MAG: arsenate reductase ArsC [Anaerolineae bacterium]|nr:arsenate reductase ArsC [Anaerolineae bacterium]